MGKKLFKKEEEKEILLIDPNEFLINTTHYWETENHRIQHPYQKTENINECSVDFSHNL